MEKSESSNEECEQSQESEQEQPVHLEKEQQKRHHNKKKKVPFKTFLKEVTAYARIIAL